MYSHAYARVQSSNDSQVEHLIRYDQLYEYHEALALANRELCYVGSSSNVPDTAAVGGSFINVAAATEQNVEENSNGVIIPKEINLDEFWKIHGIN